MTYKVYPDQFTYVVHHTTGCGEQGGEPIREHEIVFSSESYEECLAKGRELYPPSGSGWDYDNFTINVNITTTKGIQLLDKFREEGKVLEQHMKDNPEQWRTYTFGGHTMHLQYNPAFDEPSAPTS